MIGGQKFKSIILKVWYAILLGAIVQVGLLNNVEAKSSAKAKSTSSQETSHTSDTKAPTLSLEDFLSQVRSGNSKYKGEQQYIEGANLHADEYKLITRPTLVGSADYMDNRAETDNPFTGNIVRSRNYSLGVKEVTDFGLTGTLSYKMGWNSIPEAQAFPGFTPERTYFTASPVLELSQSLWRNGFGRGVRAQKELVSAQALQTKYQNSYDQKQLIADAETAYWRLALARESVDLAKENLNLADRLRSWSQGRQRSGLGDKSDYLQANASYLARQLDFQRATDDEKAASRAFNTVRGIDSEQVSETLIKFDSDIIDKRIRLPEKADMRDDVKAAQQTARAAAANAKINAEKNRPQVDIHGSIAFNGRDISQTPADRESFTSEHPTYAVGVSLEIPLDIGSASDAVKGYKGEARAAQLVFEQKKFETDRQWKDLAQGLQDSLHRYHLANEIEKSQQEKLQYERFRHDRGRTTTFQVIQFETDYALAQFNRIQTQVDILNQYAKLRTFAGGSQ